MSDPIDPIPGVAERRAKDRRKSDRRSNDRRKAGGSNLPVPVSGPARPSPIQPREDVAAAAFAAQLMGQEGEKRGLRGGKPVLDKARSAYLEAEWTGPKDRRLRVGKIAKTEI